MDKHRAFINERCKFEQLVYMKKPPRSDSSFKYGQTTGIVEVNLYRNPLTPYNYLEGLFSYMKSTGFRHKYDDFCLG